MSFRDDRRHLVPVVLRRGDDVIYIHNIDLGEQMITGQEKV